MIRVGPVLHRLADELTAVLGGLLGYVAVLAALGVGVVYLLELGGASAAMEPGPGTGEAALERPYVIDDEGPNRPELRRAVAGR